MKKLGDNEKLKKLREGAALAAQKAQMEATKAAVRQSKLDRESVRNRALTFGSLRKTIPV